MMCGILTSVIYFLLFIFNHPFLLRQLNAWYVFFTLLPPIDCTELDRMEASRPFASPVLAGKLSYA